MPTIKIREYNGRPTCSKFCYGTKVVEGKQQLKSLYIHPPGNARGRVAEVELSDDEIADLMETSSHLIEVVYVAPPKRKRRTKAEMAEEEKADEENQSGD